MPDNRPAGRGGRPSATQFTRGRPVVRARVGFIVVALLVSVIGVRLFQLQGVDSEYWATLAAKESMREVVLPATRGDIVDRNGTLLAGSVSGRMLVANPQETSENARSIARVLTKTLNLDYDATVKVLSDTDGGSQFAYVARRVPAIDADRAVAELTRKGLKGITTRVDPMREYPQRDVAANLVGFMGDYDAKEGEEKPLYGLERTFNTQLKGTDGHSSYQTGSGGYRIPQGKNTVVKPQDGETLTTTLDARLQWYATRQLAQAVRASGAVSATAVVMSTKTGDLLALADYPTYDASNPLPRDSENFEPRSLTEPYEPGSVEKVLTTAALLDAGKVTPRTKIVVPSQLRRQDRPIGDWWDHGSLNLTMTGVLAKSSNIGTVLAADKLSAPQLMTYLDKFGLGQKTGIGYPGETRGIVPQGAGLSSQVKDRITFGQSISVNAVQMTAAVNAVANKGTYVAPNLVRGSATTRDGVRVGTDHPVTRRVVSEQAATQTAAMMERVLTQREGAVSPAAVNGYRVAGKTGTAQRVDPECQCYRGTSVSFGGFAPADDPQITVYVVIHAPREGSAGGSTAGPVFSKLLGYALTQFDVQPTNTPPSRLPLEW